MISQDQLVLSEESKAIARRYIWWQPAEQTLSNVPRFLAHAMNLATWEDQLWLESHFDLSALVDALAQAPAGVFTPQSWNYWHIRLDQPPRALPRKIIPEIAG